MENINFSWRIEISAFWFVYNIGDDNYYYNINGFIRNAPEHFIIN
jgi:hypothetical protein